MTMVGAVTSDATTWQPLRVAVASDINNLRLYFMASTFKTTLFALSAAIT